MIALRNQLLKKHDVLMNKFKGDASTASSLPTKPDQSMAGSIRKRTHSTATAGQSKGNSTTSQTSSLDDEPPNKKPLISGDPLKVKPQDIRSNRHEPQIDLLRNAIKFDEKRSSNGSNFKNNEVITIDD